MAHPPATPRERIGAVLLTLSWFAGMSAPEITLHYAGPGWGALACITAVALWIGASSLILKLCGNPPPLPLFDFLLCLNALAVLLLCGVLMLKPVRTSHHKQGAVAIPYQRNIAVRC